jgi:hypothetical protein
MSGKALIIFVISTGGFPFAMAANNIDIFGFNIKALVLLFYLGLVLLAIFSDIGKSFNKMFVFKICLLLLLYALFSIFWSENFLYGIRSYMKFSAPFVFLLGVIVFLKTDNDLEKCVLAVYRICIIVSLLAIINVITGGLFESLKGTEVLAIGLPSLQAPSTSPANFSFLMACGAIVSFVDYLVDRRKSRLLLFLYFSICVLWAFTRISIGGLFISIGVCMSMLSNSRIFKFILPLGFLALLLISFLTVESLSERMFFNAKKTNISELASNPQKMLENVNTSGRSYLWELAAKEFKNSDKVFGAGIGAVDHWVSQFTWVKALHSDYLKTYYDLGFVGLIIYLLTFISFLYFLIRVNRSYLTKRDKKWGAIAFSAVIFYMITLLTDNSINYALDFGLYVYSFVGFAWVHYENERNRQSVRKPLAIFNKNLAKIPQ